MEEKVIEIKSLGVNYGEKEVLKNIEVKKIIDVLDFEKSKIEKEKISNTIEENRWWTCCCT